MMESPKQIMGPLSLEMATEADYREKAALYRISAQYNEMIGLYPILQTSIKDCKDEKLVA